MSQAEAGQESSQKDPIEQAELLLRASTGELLDKLAKSRLVTSIDKRNWKEIEIVDLWALARHEQWKLIQDVAEDIGQVKNATQASDYRRIVAISCIKEKQYIRGMCSHEQSFRELARNAPQQILGLLHRESYYRFDFHRRVRAFIENFIDVDLAKAYGDETQFWNAVNTGKGPKDETYLENRLGDVVLAAKRLSRRQWEKDDNPITPEMEDRLKQEWLVELNEAVPDNFVDDEQDQKKAQKQAQEQAQEQA